MRTISSIEWLIRLLVVLSMIASGTLQADSTFVLVDHFDNGVPADTDDTAGFWRVISDKRADYLITENDQSNGALNVKISGGQPGKNPNLLLCSDVSDKFDFSTGSVTISGRGLKFQVVGESAKPWECIMRFSLTSESAHPWGSPDAICLVLASGGDFQFGWKTSQANMNPPVIIAVRNNTTQLKLGTITGFDLTLSQKNYNLVLHTTDKNATFDGRYADKGPWTSWGSSAVAMDFQRNTQNVVRTAHFQISELTVKRTEP